MYELTKEKLAAKQAVRLEWIAKGGKDISIIISNPGLGQVLFTESDTGENVEVFEENQTDEIIEAIKKYEKEGYDLQN